MANHLKPVGLCNLSVIDACFSKAGEVYNLISQYEKCLHTPGTPGLEELIEEM